MRSIAYILIFGLITSWLLSFQETHLCRDDSTFSASLSSPVESFDNELINPSDKNEHDLSGLEMCHFGHCVHAVKISSLLPLKSFTALGVENSTPYKSIEHSEYLFLSLRPPARA
jgi:hypothetical protein